VGCLGVVFVTGTVKNCLVFWNCQKSPCFLELSKIALFSGTVKNRLVFWNCQKSHCFLELSKIALFSRTVKNRLVYWNCQKSSCFLELSKIALFSGTVKNCLVFWNCQKLPCFLELSKISLFSGTVKNCLVFWNCQKSPGFLELSKIQRKSRCKKLPKITQKTSKSFPIISIKIRNSITTTHTVICLFISSFFHLKKNEKKLKLKRKRNRIVLCGLAGQDFFLLIFVRLLLGILSRDLTIEILVLSNLDILVFFFFF
jgi:hypothetical protein